MTAHRLCKFCVVELVLLSGVSKANDARLCNSAVATSLLHYRDNRESDVCTMRWTFPDSAIGRVRDAKFSNSIACPKVEHTDFEFSSFTPLPLYCRIDSHQKNHGCEIKHNILV